MLEGSVLSPRDLELFVFTHTTLRLLVSEKPSTEQLTLSTVSDFESQRPYCSLRSVLAG